MENYDWPRYWFRADANPRIDDNGLLVVWDRYENACFAIDHYCGESALILLGDPGMGKTYELEAFHRLTRGAGHPTVYENLNAIPDTTQLIRKVFQNEEIEKWKAGSGTLHLFLDSLDEALININVLSNFLVDELKRLPTERLFLRISCRSSEWDSFAQLDTLIKEKWGGGPLYLAPLRSEDLAATAQVALGDRDRKFIDGIFSKGLGPLAAKPVTLLLLLDIFRRDGRFPSTKSQLYYDGCLLLCDEDYNDRPASREKDLLGPLQRMKIASTVAAVSVFSNRSGLWIGREGSAENESHILPSELVQFGINEKALNETIKKGLFQPAGVSQLRFTHQTFAEYLAAWYLDDQQVSDEGIIELIGGDTIHPQLYETASWIANNRPAVFEHLLEVNPMVLLRSDVLAVDDVQRGRLVERLLSAYENNESYETHEFQSFKRLSNSKLADQLRVYINDREKPSNARIAAINMARSCELGNLAPDLLNRALDTVESHSFRRNALYAFTEIEHRDDRRLDELLLEDETTDPSGDLRLHALESLWPEHLTSQKLFDNLNRIDKGIPYTLAQKIKTRISPEELPIALSWFKEKATIGGLPYYDDRLLGDLVLSAWDYLHRPEIRKSLAELTIAFARQYHDLFRQTLSQEELNKLLNDTGNRRKVLLEMLSDVKNEEELWQHFYNSSVLTFYPQDAEWMIEEYCRSPHEGVSNLLLSIVKGWILQSQGFYSPGMDPALLNQIMQGKLTCPEFAAEVSDLTGHITLNSHEHSDGLARYKTFLSQKMKWSRVEETERLLDPSPTELVTSALDEFERGDIAAWWEKINYFMRFSPTGRTMAISEDLDLTAFPVWPNLNDSVRGRLVSAAKEYLIHGDPRTDEWFGKADPNKPAAAGYRALSLVYKFEPTFFDSVPSDLWKRWVPTVFGIWANNSDRIRKGNEQFMALAYRSAPLDVGVLLAKHLESANSKLNPILNLQKFDKCWDEELLGVLRQSASDSGTSHEVFEQILWKLFELNDPRVVDIACRYVVYPLPNDQFERAKSLIAIRYLISNGTVPCWSNIWKAISGDDDSGKSLIESVIHGSYSARRVPLVLSEPDAAELYLWLARNYPHAEDPVRKGVFTPTARDDVAHWRESFLYDLVERGTREAVAQLERIKRELPKLQSIDHLLVDARRKYHANSWVPPSIDDFRLFLGIDKVDQRIRKLKGDWDNFEQKKAEAGVKARSYARNLSFTRWISIVLIALIWIALVYLLGWDLMEPVTWGVGLGLSLLLLGIACWHLQDSYFPLRPGTIFEIEKEIAYREAGLDLNEGELLRNQLVQLKLERQELISQSASLGESNAPEPTLIMRG